MKRYGLLLIGFVVLLSSGFASAQCRSGVGYYTVHTLKNGKIYGMLGVNGYTGQVWYHTWHGDFLRMKEFGGHD